MEGLNIYSPNKKITIVSILDVEWIILQRIVELFYGLYLINQKGVHIEFNTALVIIKVCVSFSVVSFAYKSVSVSASPHLHLIPSTRR